MQKDEKHTIELYDFWDKIKTRFGIIDPQPKSFDLTQRVVPITNIDSFGLELIDLSTDDTVTHGPTSDTLYLQPPKGVIYQVVDIFYQALAPVGDTAGTHTLYFGHYMNSTERNIAYLIGNHSTNIDIKECKFQGTSSELPATVSEQVGLTFYLLYASYDCPLFFRYYNATDADQTGTRTLNILVKKTPQGAF